jgi:hypothetical protein
MGEEQLGHGWTPGGPQRRWGRRPDRIRRPRVSTDSPRDLRSTAPTWPSICVPHAWSNGVTRGGEANGARRRRAPPGICCRRCRCPCPAASASGAPDRSRPLLHGAAEAPQAWCGVGAARAAAAAASGAARGRRVAAAPSRARGAWDGASIAPLLRIAYTAQCTSSTRCRSLWGTGDVCMRTALHGRCKAMRTAGEGSSRKAEKTSTARIETQFQGPPREAKRGGIDPEIQPRC